VFAYPDLANHGFHLNVIYLTLDILVVRVYRCNVKFELQFCIFFLQCLCKLVISLTINNLWFPVHR